MFSYAKIFTTLGLIIFASTAANAEEIDLQKILMDRFSQWPRAHEVVEGNARCRKTPIAGSDCVKMEFRNIKSNEIAIEYSQIKVAPIPETVITESVTFKNCSSIDRKDTKELTVSFTEGYNIITTDSVKNTNGTNIKLAISGIDLGISQTNEISFNESKTNNFSKNTTEVVRVDETIKPMTALLIQIEKRISNAYLDFSGVVNVDAEVWMITLPPWTGENTNFGPLSQLAGPQTVSLKGQIWNAKAQRTEKYYSERSLNPKDPKDCLPIPFKIL